MQKVLPIHRLFLVIVFFGQICRAQSNNPPFTKPDSIIIIKQSVKEQLGLQLQQSGVYKKVQQNMLRGLLNDTSAVDTLSKLVIMEMHQLKNIGINTGKIMVKDAGNITRQPLREAFAQVSQVQQVKNIFGRFTGILKQPAVQWNGGSVDIEGQTAHQTFNMEAIYFNNSTVNSSWSFLGIPADLQFTRQDFAGPACNTRTIFSFQFDREAYANLLRDKIKLHMKAGHLLPDYTAALEKMATAAVAGLRRSLDSIGASYKGVLEKQFNLLGDPQNLLKVDLDALRDKLLSAEFLQTLQNNNNQLAQLQQQLNAGSIINTRLYDSLLWAVQAVSGVHALIEKIQSFKETAQKSGLLEKLHQAEQFKDNSMQEWLGDADKIKLLARQQLNVTALQRLFLNINRLQLGMNNINLSALTLYQYVNNGVNAEFLNNKTYLFVMAGKTKEFNGLYGNGFSGSSMFATANSAAGVRVGRGDMQSSYAHFSLFSYKQHKGSSDNNLISVVPGKTVVVTFSNQLTLNKANYFNLEVSKSVHAYDNQRNSYDTLLQQGSSLSKQLLAGGNFMQQVAFSIQWNGETKEKSLVYDINATHTGRSYNNPGNHFLPAGITEFGGHIKKSFLESRLQISAKGNRREYDYNISHSKYSMYNFSFLAKWKLRKGQYISIRYQPSRAVKWQDDKKTSVGGSSRLALDMAMRRRVGRVNYQHIISLSAIKNSYSFDAMPYTTNGVFISSMQTITVNKKSYYCNMQYNQVITPSVMSVFNSQLNCDLGIVYTLGKMLVASTSINYNSCKDWFQQIGIKQSIGGRLGKKISLSLNTTILTPIKEFRSNTMDNVTANWSLQYLLK